ncbi:AraC family transcriptional regulator [bacterium]|nr:AraC family transcriptional regulator [bacterium]
MRKSAAEYYRYLAVNPRDHAWGLCVTGAGYQPSAPGVAGVPRRRHPPGHYYSWEAGRVLNEYAVVYVTHGQGEFDSQATGLRQLEPGDAILLFPGVWHRYRPRKDTGWGSYWIHFEGDTADRLREAGAVQPQRAVLRVGLDETILQAFTTVLDVLRSESAGFAQIAAARTTEILARIVGTAGTERPVPRLQAIVRRARLMLEEDPGSLPNVEEMIRSFDVSRTHFFRVFKEQTGQSPYKYHLQLTIRRAAEMLRDSSLSVKAIALALGFRNPYHFSKLFKLKTGSSPRDYRQHWRTVSAPAARAPSPTAPAL